MLSGVTLNRSCSYCGLPVRGGGAGDVYCCQGCWLVSRIVGQGAEGPRTWEVLRLSIGALLAMEVMMLALLLYTGTVEGNAVPVFRWAMFGLATGAMALTGYPFVRGAMDEFRQRRLSLQSLIALGSFAAYLTSAVNVVRGEGQVYFDTATMLPVLVLFGRLIEATAKTRAGELLRGLESLLPARALRLGPEGPQEIPLADLQAGDRVRVRPGERIPADGRIVEGCAVIEEAVFTGEPLPRARGPGDTVLAGTINGADGIVVEVEHAGEDVMLRRIIQMAEQARQSATRTERLAERAAAVFVPAVVLLAAGTGVYWAMRADWVQAGAATLAVLVVACPCALGIATPLVTALAIARAAREGILIRGGDVLERIGLTRTLYFDKTGTLTAGRPAVAAVQSLDPSVSEDDLLGWLSGLEAGSEHPLARAVVAEARARNLEIGSVRDLRATPGQGVRGMVVRGGETREIIAGTSEYVGAEDGASSSSPAMRGVAMANPCAASVINVAWGGRTRGLVHLADPIRPGAAEAVQTLRRAGVCPVLLSGDRRAVAEFVAQQVGIDEVRAPCRPEEKATAVRGEDTGMVGDGINDAPALSTAGVGIALGAGTDMARQAGNIVLLGDRLDQVPWLVHLSRRARRIIVQNLAWAFGYNLLALAAAATGLLHPLLAAVAMVISSLTLLGNSMRITRFA